MTNKDFLDRIIEDVRENVSIIDEVGQYTYLKKDGVEYEGLCPFHNDTKVGSFKVSERKKICKCFSCGAGGDVIKVHALKKNINYIESALHLAVEHNRITEEEYNKFSNKEYSGKNNKKAKTREIFYSKKDAEQFKNIIAPDEILNNVYTAFYNVSTLSKEHEEYLKNERKYSDQDIKEGKYFTFPSRNIMKVFEERLKKDYGYDPDILTNVPGFYRDKESGYFTFAKNSGLGICITNAKGFIIRIQIRRDKAQINKSRYIWFSSSFIEKDEKLMEKFDCATGAGSGIDVVYPKVLKYRTMFITEGRFKAKKIADTFNCVAISVQGVTNWRNIEKEIECIQENYKDVEFKNIYVAYDADIAYNTQVFNQAMKMVHMLKKAFINMAISYVLWDVNYGKGIDDLINAGYHGMLETKESTEFEKLYKDFVEAVEKKHGNIQKNKVKKIILKEYYEAIVMTEENFPKISNYIAKNNYKEVVGL